MIKRSIIILILLGYQATNAQHIEIGGEIGDGKTLLNDHLDFGQLFGSSTVNNLKLGFIISLRPNITDLVFISGIIYQHKEKGGPSLNFFKVPIGIDVEPGGKVRFIVGGGFYLSYLFITSGFINPDFNASKTVFQVGSFLDMGFKYQIMASWSVFIKMQVDFDLTPLYKKSIPNHDGSSVYKNIRAYDYVIDLGFFHLIEKAK